METYGISIDKFLATDAGIVYLDIRDRILPYLREQKRLLRRPTIG